MASTSTLTKTDKTQTADGIPEKKAYQIIKRAFDLGFSIFCIILLLLPMMILAVLVAVTSSGGPIFSQERLGKNGKSFVIYKFRSMKRNAEHNGPQLATQNDPRCTKIGRFLRKTKLDELPQIFNIFLGDMSFVGPRPERPFFYERYDSTVPGFRKRLDVKPGLTGYAQLIGGYATPPEIKIQYDLQYIEKRSLGFDFLLLLKTPVYLIQCLVHKSENGNY